DADHLPRALQPDHGIERVIAQFRDHDFVHLRIKARKDILNKVVSHRTRRGYFFDLQRDGVGLIDADPDGQNCVAAHVFEDHDRHVRYRVHHETANFHLYFHRDPQKTFTNYDVRCTIFSRSTSTSLFNRTSSIVIRTSQPAA